MKSMQTSSTKRKALIGVGAGIVGTAMMLTMATSTFAQPNPQKELCKKGGFADFDFRNQGRCIKFVNQGGNIEDIAGGV